MDYRGMITRFLTFGAGSAIGAAIDLLIGLALLRLGLSAWMALGLAMSVSASVVYVFHQKLTFGDIHTRDINGGRFTKFILNTFAIYVFRVLLFDWLRGLEFTDFAALAIALVASVALNYTISRALIFSRVRADSGH